MAYRTHDQALSALREALPEMKNGAPNHAPMVVEALAAMGREHAVPQWIERVRPRLAETPGGNARPILDREPALGDAARIADWHDLFRRELETSAWQEVLERWLPRLIPGSMAAGTHGIIRCGHACRALADQATSLRRDELAAALAYCASRYRKINGTPLLAGPLGLEQAARELPILPAAIERHGPPPKVIRHLDELDGFAWAVSRLAPPADPFSALGELAEIGARLYLQEASRHPLVLLHAVTGPAAVQLLVVHASPALRATAFAYMWQAVAAWTSAFSRGLSDRTPGKPDQPCDESWDKSWDKSWDELIDLSVDSGDDHAIKLTEACLRLERLRSSTVFRAVASDWVHRVIGSRGSPAERLVAAGIRTRMS